MAISFPRALPLDIQFLHARFVLQRFVASVAGSSRINYTEVDDPVWTITFPTKRLRESQVAALDAWWSSLRDMLPVLVTQNVTCRPFAHAAPENAAPAQDAGVLDSITNGNALAVSGVSASLVLQAGDLLGLEYSGKRGLHRVVEATGAGTSRTITVDPFPRSYVGIAGAVVRFENPSLIMRPVPKSWTLSEGSRTSASFSFVEAME